MKNQLMTLMLERCAQTLEQVIAPNVTDAFAAAQAAAIAELLRALAPVAEMKTQVFRDEIQEMREALGKVLETLRGEKAASRDRVGSELIACLDRDLNKAGVVSSDVGEEHDNLKGALVATIEGLDALRRTLPEETLSSLTLQIRGVLRRQLDHEIAHMTLPI